MCTGLIWLRFGTSGGILRELQWNFGPITDALSVARLRNMAAEVERIWNEAVMVW